MPFQFSRRSGRAPLIAGLLLLGVILGSGWGISAFRADRSNAGLAVAAEDLNFGSAWESTAFPWVLTIDNPTAEPVLIESWEVSCSCTKAEPPRLTIPPGESRDVSLTLNLSSVFPADSVADSALFSVRLVPIVAGAPRDTGWEISGSIERPILFQPQRLQATLVDGRPLEVQVMAQVPLDPARIEFPPRYFSSANLVEASAASGRFQLTLVPNADLPAGLYATEVVLHPASHDDGISGARLPVTLTVPGPLMATPKEISFGGISPGEAPAETLVLETRDADDPVRIVETRSGGSAILRCETGGQFLPRHEFQVIANYQTAGSHAGALEIITENAAGRRTTMTVPLRAYVLSAQQAEDLGISPREPVEAPTPR